MTNVADNLPFEHRPLSRDETNGEEGWYTWNLIDRTRYNTQVLGEMWVRTEGDLCRLRMFPERRHTNLADNIHGAVSLGLIDIALFATLHMIGQGDAGPSVTVELSTQFVGPGDPTQPLDAVSEITQETGRMMFARGQCVQGGRIVTSYSGIVRKMKPLPVS
ncbi:MAG: PaaI family thioesterase [Erythrobacter sp.]|uniref:PaaI family thioesterase n=1 Tax=Erythrobacter sp. TaxID=1042 RepID=UPI0026291883|nr:PaaI family thioesterase [Erythrobacter sp.]MDJ0977845.1 PaaI family thioesterase [Erythrobacter sp.]